MFTALIASLILSVGPIIPPGHPTRIITCDQHTGKCVITIVKPHPCPGILCKGK